VIAPAGAGFQTIGQPVAERLVRGLLGRSDGPATILISGPRGSGKTAFVDDLVALALCEAAEPSDRPCNACFGCRHARARTHPDLLVASPERWRDDRGSAESIVSAARRWLAEAAGSPLAGRLRVVVIERADAANEQIQNALLKALEEPADRQLFILVADDLSRILPTIQSRAGLVRLGTMPSDVIAGYLVEHEQVTDEQARTLARLAGGRMGQALAFAREPTIVDWRRRTQQELVGLLEGGPADRMSAVRELIDDRSRLSRGEVTPDDAEGSGRAPNAVQRAAAVAIVDAWLDLARDLVVARSGAPDLAVSEELVTDLPAVARRLEPGRLTAAVLSLERARTALDENVSPRLALEYAMLAWPRLASVEA
jgi:DNA polymerase-3 subunit delta'